MLTSEEAPIKGWVIVGCRADGSRLILEERSTRDEALARAGVLAAQLEDYTQIRIESTKGGKEEIVMDRTERINHIKERHMALHEQPPSDGAHEEPAPAAPPLGRRKRGERLRQILLELGPAASNDDVRRRAEEAGLDVPNGKRIWDARQQLAREDGTARAPAAPRPAPRPREVQAPAPAAAAAATPCATTTDQVLEGLALLAEAAGKLGGIGQARRALETLELLQEGRHA